MKKATKNTRRLALVFTLIGAVMFFLGWLVFTNVAREGVLTNFFPRHDIAHIGFILLGGTYWIIAGALAMLSASKSAMTEEGDERMVNIGGKAGQIAYIIQTCVLFTLAIFMTFAGYLEAPGLLAMDAALVAGIVSYLLFTFYYRRKM